MRNTGELISRFREQGRKVAPQRELVFRILENNSLHPTAESVYMTAVRTMPTISLKTVYQVLNDLRDLREIQAIEVGGGALRFASGIGVPRSKRQGFSIDAVEVVFRGVCVRCKRTSESAHNE